MKRLTYKFVKEQIENVKGYILLSKSYKNNRQKLLIQCDKGHEYEVIYSNFQQGERCSICNGGIKLNYNFIKSQIKKEGYKLLSKYYINANKKIKIKCNKGHKYEVKYGNFQQGKRCSVCNGNAKHTYEYIKEQIESVKGYKLLSKDYKNCSTKLLIQCNESHKYKVKWNHFEQGCRCPICDEKSSKAEKEILKIVKQLLPDEDVIENDRTQIINPLTGYNLELDIYIPKLKKAIEFNGTYWHSSDYSKYKDSVKVKQCKEKGIDLLIINEQDWLDNKNEIIEKLNLFGNKLS